MTEHTEQPPIRPSRGAKLWASIAVMCREKKLQLLGVMLSGASAWFASQNYFAQSKAAIPRLVVRSVYLYPVVNQPKLQISYHNVGGTASGSVRFSYKYIHQDGTGLTSIADVDDGSVLLKDDDKGTIIKSLVMPIDDIFLACVVINDPRTVPEMFAYHFNDWPQVLSSNDGSTGVYGVNISSKAWATLEAKKPCAKRFGLNDY